MNLTSVSMDTVIGLIIGVIIPIMFWGLRLFWMAKHSHKIHANPDDHGFGTGGTNELLRTLIDNQNEIHIDHMSANKSLRYTIRELSHYVRWDATQRTGKTPPPYVRNGE